MTDTLEDLLADGNNLWRGGELEKATDLFRRAVELAEQSFGAESMEMIKPLRGLAASIAPPIDGTFEQYEQALELHLRALNVSEAHLGQGQERRVLERAGLRHGQLQGFHDGNARRQGQRQLRLH